MLYTKDGVPIGDQKEFVSACVEAANTELMEVEGMQFKTSAYCTCVAHKLIPSINSHEMEEALEKENMEQLFLSDQNLRVLLECVEEHVTLESDFEFGTFKDNKLSREVSVRLCFEEMKSQPEMDGLISDEQAVKYCQCAVQKLYEEGYTYGDLATMEQEDSEGFNELVVPCLNAAFGDDAPGQNNHHVADDLTGPEQGMVQLTSLLGKGFNIKLEVNGVVKYFLFDTGASDLMINSELEEVLLANGSLEKSDYLGKNDYELADGSIVEGQLVRLDDVQIGDYTVRNVVAAILDEGSLLCGKGLMDKFSNWTFDAASGKLTLQR